MPPNPGEAQTVHVTFDSYGGQFYLRSSLKTPWLTAPQKMATLNFVRETRLIIVRHHAGYLFALATCVLAVAILMAISLALRVWILMIPATLIKLAFIILLIRYWYIVRAVSLRWECLVERTHSLFPNYELRKGRLQWPMAQFFFWNCNGIEFELVSIEPVPASGDWAVIQMREAEFGRWPSPSTAGTCPLKRSNGSECLAGPTQESLDDLPPSTRPQMSHPEEGSRPGLQTPPRGPPLDTSILDSRVHILSVVTDEAADLVAQSNLAFLARSRFRFSDLSGDCDQPVSVGR